MVHPLRKISVNFSGATLAELNALARELNFSIEVLIKKLVREGLDSRRMRLLSSQPAAIHSRSIKHLRRASGKNRAR